MATPIRRVQATEVNFGDMAFYTAGGGLPEGDYALSFTVQMFQAQDAQGVKKGPARLAVRVEATPLSGDSEPREQFYSMGSKAHESFQPNPETGKSLIAVPGGPATTVNNSTNWAILLKSLYDSGLPQGIFTNDLSVLDGIHVHIINVPEPAERAGFQSKTGEFAEGAERKPGTVAIVSEIKDDGKPWEGTGGIPETKAATKANGKPAPKAQAPARSVAPASTGKASVQAGQDAGGEVEAAAVNGVSKVLGAQPNGCKKLLLRTSTFKEVNSTGGQEMAQAVIEQYFSSDDKLNGLLGQLGYKVKGIDVVAL
jgi:hypothetical protein